MYYPWYEDKEFNDKIYKKTEINSNLLGLIKNPKRCIENYQYLVSNFINPQSPYRSLLLFFFTGVGKTIASISIAENFVNESNKSILVITKNQEFIKNFKNEYLTICQDLPYEKARNRLNKHYSFITYKGLKSDILNFTDKIVIIDEIHNLLGNTGYTDIMKIIKRSQNNYKLLLLSATPIFDKLKDTVELTNLLNGKTNQITDTRAYFEIDNTINDIFLYTDKIYKLTEFGQKDLLSKLVGKVSYLKTGFENFPKVIENGTDYVKGNKLSVKVIECYMEPHQEKIYTELLNGINFNDAKIQSILEYASSIIYPLGEKGGYYMSSRGYKKYIIEGKDKSFLKFENIKKYSTKLYHLLLNLKSLKGKAYIYSKYITADGIALIYECLKKNGYKKILYVDSDTSSIVSKIDFFNSEENKNGEKYNIILASGVIAEGYTFKNIRQVHLYEPDWNLSTMDQIIGRAVRKSSHSTLPENERTVEIFRYCAIPSLNYGISLDFSKYLKSSRKDVYIKGFERLLAKNSFSCEFFKQKNINKDGKDYSRECDYDVCEYNCVTKKSDSSDFKTYRMKYHNKEHYKILTGQIIEMFNKYKILTLKDILKKSTFQEHEVLNVITLDPPLPLIKQGEYYSISKQAVNTLKGALIRSKTTIQYKGILIDGKFKITYGDKTGTVCESFNKMELISICKSVGVNVDIRDKKIELCKKLQNKLIG